MTTNIEWCQNPDGSKGETWNPITGCSKASDGCTNCYALTMAHRLSKIPATRKAYAPAVEKRGGKVVWTGIMSMSDKVLTKPLRRKKPTTYFISMTDIFHENVEDDILNDIISVIMLCPQHTFQILTKRPERAQKYFEKMERNNNDDEAGFTFGFNHLGPVWFSENTVSHPDHNFSFPLKNLWLGTSIENQETADERIPHLQRTHAAVRFISYEPALGPVDFMCDLLDDIDWLICGGESGPNARPMHPSWARSARDDCADSQVPFFFKQWGEWSELIRGDTRNDWALLGPDGIADVPDDRLPDKRLGEVAILRRGKKAAGRLLDGIFHNALPTRPAGVLQND